MTARLRYPRLLSPIRIGPMTLAHRAIMSAHGMGLGAGGPGVSDRYHEYLLERARGGAAMVGIESSPVHHTTFSRSLVIRLDDDQCIPGLARLADAVHAVGAKLAITLWHGGHKDGWQRGPWSVAPSPIPSLSGEMPRALTRCGIHEIVRAYGEAAARCRRAGLDCLEVQTATDYLLGSFLSPALNHRRDEYGGTLENRARIVRQVLEAVRESAGASIAVGVRCSARHDIPGATVDYTLEESIATMTHLDAAGLVDYVSVMAGSAWAEGVSIPAQHHPRACLVHESARFKQALKVPVFVAGRFRTPSEAEGAIAAQQADVIAMARTWIAEPHWGRKLIENREEQIRPCMSCNQGCVGSVFRGMPGTCVVNPRAGREIDWPAAAAARPRRVQGHRLAVIGGGPAGLETARLAAEAGFDVELHEATERLGGQWRWAGETPGREELLLPLQWWANELERLRVRVHLASTVAVDQPPQADTVIWATGSVPAQAAVWRLRPFLFDGIPGAAVHGVWSRDYLAGRASLSGRVAVVDEEGGWPAISLVARLLADRRVERIELFTTEAEFGESTVAVTFEAAALRRLIPPEAVDRKMIIHSKSRVQAITSNSVSTDAARGSYDHVLLSTGTLPAPSPEDSLAVGDCVAPRGLWSACTDAQRVVRQLLAALDDVHAP